MPIPHKKFNDHKTAADRRRPRQDGHDNSHVWTITLMIISAIAFFALIA